MRNFTTIHLFPFKQVVFALFFFFSIQSKAQTIVYSEGFNSTLAASGWTVTNLTVPYASGNYFGFTNNWYVNDAESGMPANTCGAANMGNFSLYIGVVGLGALGAAYLSNARTNRRIQSPLISTVGYSGMTLSFDFIGNGETNDDKAYLQYSIDGGTTWINATGAPTSTNPAVPVGSNLNNLKSQICGSGQGRWTNLTWDMPVTCENIPNLRIAFVWQNDNDATATDPAFAVNDVSITVPTVLPVELLSFTGKHQDRINYLFWETASESNNDFFTLEHSVDGIFFSQLSKIPGAGNSNHLLHYSFTHLFPQQGINYYRLKQTDFNGSIKYSNTIILHNTEKIKGLNLVHAFFNSEQNQIEFILNCESDCDVTLELIDLSGRKLITKQANAEGNYTKIVLPVPVLSSGIYLIKIYNGSELFTRKIKL